MGWFKRFCIGTYLIAAILTFGHAASRYTVRNSYESSAVAVPSFFGGLLWPLYWSWTLQE